MSRRVRRRVVAAVAAVLAVAAIGFGVTTAGKLDAAPGVVAYMADAGSLEAGNEVRVDGVKVGAIRDITLDKGQARVTLDVDRAVLPLHRDASLKVRPVNLLGENYLDLNPGSPAQPYAEQAVIPPERADFAVTLQDVLNTFHDPTSAALASAVGTLGEGVQGSGGQAAAAIKALAPAMTDTKALGDLLSQQNQVLDQLVTRLDPVGGALAADNGEKLSRLVGSTTQTLSTVSGEQAALDQTLVELPGTIQTARQTLAQLGGVADSATPTLRSLRPITGNLNQITAELQQFADTADPALSSLRPVLDHASVLLDEAGPEVAELRQAGPSLRGTAASARPIGDQLLDKHLGDLMEFVRKWALSTNGRDGLSHYFRGVVFVTPQTLQDLAHSALPAAGGPSQPAPPQPVPSLPLPGLGLPQLPGSGPTLSAPLPDPGNATGLTPNQEQNMLGQLLGGQ